MFRYNNYQLLIIFTQRFSSAKIVKYMRHGFFADFDRNADKAFIYYY